MLRALLALSLLVQAPAVPRAFDSGRAWEHLRELVAFGPRPAGSPALAQSRAYIETQLKAAGIAVAEQAWDEQTPAGLVHMVNVIATIPGAVHPSGARIIMAGHYDTKRFHGFRFVGANDGGSSAAFLLEIGRVLAARKNALPIELLFLDGEEAIDEQRWAGTDHTYGSRHYVEAARRAGTLGSIKAMVLVDMIADRDLAIQRDTNSTRWLTDIIWNAASGLKLDAAFPQTAADIDDDHVPFLQAGVPSVDVIDLDYGGWHTPADTLDAVSARSLQMVGDVLLAALPRIEAQ